MSDNLLDRSSVGPAYEHCTVARDDGSLAAGILLNLSDRAFCVESRHALEIGERIEIRVLGLGRVPGVVRWIDGNRAGGLVEPLNSD